MKKKFRAFNTDDKMMWSAQDLLDNGYIFTFDGEVRLESFCGTQGDVYNEFIVLQYTGLKDKNEVDICEGDIIKQKPYHGLSKVVFDNKYGHYEAKYWFSNSMESGWCGRLVNSVIQENIEVVGNIYESPDLLKGGDNG